MLKKSTTRCSIESWVRTLSSGMGAMILAILIVAMAVPLRLAATELANESQEFSEDGEPTEESETDGEQVLFTGPGSQTVRARQLGIRFVSPAAVANSLRCAPSRTTSGVANELQQRNGIGGPLRC